MQTLSEFFRLEYVPAFLKDRDKRTLTAYKSSINLVVEILDDPTINEVGLYGSVFVRDATRRGLSAATVAKHCRHLNAVFTAIQTTLGYKPGWQLPTVQKHDPKIVTDFEFQQLYRAFGGEEDYPQFLPRQYRPAFWRCVMHFVSITALRREAVLGLVWRNVNVDERYLTVYENIDKKDTRRYKPLTEELLAEMLELKAFGQATGKYRERLFAWPHGQKTWYKVWNNAEMLAGVKLGLHDLKRFSGELALRTGATDLELMQHMDHTDIRTTLNHYCRPKTTDLVSKIRVPIPDEFSTEPPPNSAAAVMREVEERSKKLEDYVLGVRLEKMFGLGFTEADMKRLAERLGPDEDALKQIIDSGVDLKQLAAALKKIFPDNGGDSGDYCGETYKTSTGTELRLFGGKGGAA